MKIFKKILYVIIGIICLVLFLMFYDKVILGKKSFEFENLWIPAAVALFGYLARIIFLPKREDDQSSQRNDNQSSEKPAWTNTAIYTGIVLVIILLIVWIGRITTL